MINIWTARDVLERISAAGTVAFWLPAFDNIAIVSSEEARRILGSVSPSELLKVTVTCNQLCIVGRLP